ncbi:hypothetical protein HDU83_009411 [Entophlyctis luteolus]|nr:hypothetical protein HDU83_009411 [Entophlyctis luteolus]
MRAMCRGPARSPRAARAAHHPQPPRGGGDIDVAVSIAPENQRSPHLHSHSQSHLLLSRAPTLAPMQMHLTHKRPSMLAPIPVSRPNLTATALTQADGTITSHSSRQFLFPSNLRVRRLSRSFVPHIPSLASTAVRAFSTSANSSSLRLTPEAVARLAAFSARSGIVFASRETLLRALTHKSYRDAVSSDSSAAELTDSDDSLSDEKNALLGERLLGFYLTQFVMLKYPALPAHAVESTVRAYCGESALLSVGRNLGVPEVMRWKKTADIPPQTDATAVTSANSAPVVVARVVQSLVGAIFTEHGAKAVAAFIRTHILSRQLDIVSHLKLNLNPKGTLRAILAEQKRPSPVSRMLQETGRLSSNPVFIVGVYSGIEKIGQGFGSSIAMAETRAFKNALEIHYLRETKEVVGNSGCTVEDAAADALKAFFGTDGLPDEVTGSDSRTETTTVDAGSKKTRAPAARTKTERDIANSKKDSAEE